MELEKIQSIIESILFAAGRMVSIEEIELALEISRVDLEKILEKMQEEYKEEKRGIELIKLNNGYQLCSKKENYEYIYQIIDKRNKPKLSNAALETLSIIAYNPKISRAEIEAIRGVSVDATIYKLLEYGLIEEAGKLDLPGRPMSYKTTEEFLKMFGYSSLDELPELPRYKMDENHQIVIEELEDTVVDSNQNENLEETAVDFNNQSQKENLEEENV
ncbi:MAG: SMC-Scp complex subunit ScpB [Clostridia bacterium]|nr:SMC-Scp complex subunit ScpB [Clostridia bacterium]